MNLYFPHFFHHVYNLNEKNVKCGYFFNCVPEKSLNLKEYCLLCTLTVLLLTLKFYKWLDLSWQHPQKLNFIPIGVKIT